MVSQIIGIIRDPCECGIEPTCSTRHGVRVNHSVQICQRQNFLFRSLLMNVYSPLPGQLVGHGLPYPVDAAYGNSREIDVPDGVMGRVQGCERGAVAVLDPLQPDHADCACQRDHQDHNPLQPVTAACVRKSPAYSFIAVKALLSVSIG